MLGLSLAPRDIEAREEVGADQSARQHRLRVTQIVQHADLQRSACAGSDEDEVAGDRRVRVVLRPSPIAIHSARRAPKVNEIHVRKLAERCCALKAPQSRDDRD